MMVTTTNYVAEARAAKAKAEAQALDDGRDLVKHLDRWVKYCKRHNRGTVMLTYGEYEGLRQAILLKVPK